MPGESLARRLSRRNEPRTTLFGEVIFHNQFFKLIMKQVLVPLGRQVYRPKPATQGRFHNNRTFSARFGGGKPRSRT